MSTQDTRFSGAHGHPKKSITPKGDIRQHESRLPGKDWTDGTPAYIKNAASEAARKRDFDHADHRQHVSTRAGTPPHKEDPRIAGVGRG